MGLLLDLRDITKHLSYIDTPHSAVLAKVFPENYAEAYGKDPEEVQVLYEKALRFKYIEVSKRGDAKVNPKEGTLLLRTKFGIPTGVINAYFSQNPWVNLALGFAVGIVTTLGVWIAYLALLKP